MTLQKSAGWLEWLEDRSDTFMTVAELVLVLALALFLSILAILTLFWILWTKHLYIEQERLTVVLKTLSDNWKAVLILLVPLFYRTIRKFIARIKKGPLGVEADAEEQASKLDASPAAQNPAAEEEV